MGQRRQATEVKCAICPTMFRPWKRVRLNAPTCSIKCARALTGRAQRGHRMNACLKALAAKRADEATAVGLRFGMKLTPRELAIYQYGVKVGIDREYRLHKSEQRRQAAA